MVKINLNNNKINNNHLFNYQKMIADQISFIFIISLIILKILFNIYHRYNLFFNKVKYLFGSLFAYNNKIIKVKKMINI